MEVLACPHCDRMFHATPAILGKAIRCRECRQIFRVPTDPATAELGRETPVPQPEILIAVECVIQGVDARRCPACSHTFAMQPKFVGKRIRCRGCQQTFIVLASTQAVPPPAARPSAGVAAATLQPPPVPVPPQPPAAEPAPEPEQDPAGESLPRIHEDGGDVLPMEPGGEPLVVAVRPRACRRPRARYEPIRGPFRSGRY